MLSLSNIMNTVNDGYTHHRKLNTRCEVYSNDKSSQIINYIMAAIAGILQRQKYRTRLYHFNYTLLYH